jgi:hypothetical protein
MRGAGLQLDLNIIGVGFPLLNLTERLRNWILYQKNPRTTKQWSLIEKTENSEVWNKRWVNAFQSF